MAPWMALKVHERPKHPVNSSSAILRPMFNTNLDMHTPQRIDSYCMLWLLPERQVGSPAPHLRGHCTCRSFGRYHDTALMGY